MKFLNKYRDFINEAMSLDNIYDKFYKDKIELPIFQKLISGDPTTLIGDGVPKKKGRYSDWIIKTYLNSKYKDRFMEDLYKVKDGLELFHKFKNKLDIEVRDINNFQSINDLLDVTDGLIELQEQEDLGKKEMEEIYENTIKILDNKEYLVVIPKSEESSCYYGQGTRWCTAADNYNAFDGYNRDGNLYIIINRLHDEKHQLHPATNQFMDESDSRIDLNDFINHNSVAMDAIIDWITDELIKNTEKIKDVKPVTTSDDRDQIYWDTEKSISKLITDVSAFINSNMSDRLRKVFIDNPKYVKQIPFHNYLLNFREEFGDTRSKDYIRKDGKDYLLVNDWSDLSVLFENESGAAEVLSHDHYNWGDYYHTSGFEDAYDALGDLIDCMEKHPDINEEIRKLMIGEDGVLDGDDVEITEYNYMEIDIRETWNVNDNVPEQVKDVYSASLADVYINVVWEAWTNSILNELGGDNKVEWLYPESGKGDAELMIQIKSIEYYIETYMEVEDGEPSDLISILRTTLHEKNDLASPNEDRLYPDFNDDVFIYKWSQRDDY
jgi:hypothetical protein